MSIPSLERALQYEYRGLEDEYDDKDGPYRPDGDDVTVTPSQAEGDRGTIERDLGEKDHGGHA